MIEWSDKFKTGSEALDQQHQLLIFKVNHLETLLSDTNPTRETLEFLIQLVDFLDSYAKNHFSFEEECMQRHMCPAHAKNKAEHAVFVEFVSTFRNEVRQKGLRPQPFADLHGRVSRWILDHILKVDTRLKPCLIAAR